MIITGSDITKRQGRFVLGPVHVVLEAGLVTGLIGPNGAGKSTLIRVLTGLDVPNSGSVGVERAGKLGSVDEVTCGVQSAGLRLPDWLSAHEALQFGGLYSHAEVDRALERVGFDSSQRQPVSQLSAGNAQKVALAAAFVGEPDLLVLDEPMNALDPLARRRLRDVITEERERGAIVLIATHSLADVQETCDRVIVLADGKVQQVIDRAAWGDGGVDRLEELYASTWK